MYFQPPPPSRLELEDNRRVDLNGISAQIRVSNPNTKEQVINYNDFNWSLIDLGFRFGPNIHRVAQIRAAVRPEYQQDFDDGVEKKSLPRRQIIPALP